MSHDKHERRSRLFSKNIGIQGLRLAWVIVVILCEYGVFFYAVSGCRWPDKSLSQTGSNTTPTHVLLIADPQVRDHTISSDKPWISLKSPVSTLRKSWNVATRLNPDVIVFLGDMLTTGKHTQRNETYDQYYDYFKKLFPVKASTLAYFIPGNNDIGLGNTASYAKDTREHFVSHFGPLDQAVSIAGHTLVLLNAPGLVEEDYRRHGLGQSYDTWIPTRGGTVEFLKSISPIHEKEPVILFSHIPLWRPASKSCGLLREKGTIHVGAGPGYQNTLGKETTDFVFQTLQPSAIFSADNRDYCEHMHSVRSELTNQALVREVTVKSFSPARSIQRTGFQLLSLTPPENFPSSSTTFADTPCLLPDPEKIFKTVYIPGFVLTFIALLYLNIPPSRWQQSSTRSLPALSPRLGSHSSHNPAIWPSWTQPKPKDIRSPRSSLPFLLRTQSVLEPPTLRAFPNSASPLDSPLLSPLTLYSADEETDDAMHPGQYVTHREPHVEIGVASWPTSHDDERHNEHWYETQAHTSFLPTPTSRSSAREWSWSWTFVLKGRRRRIKLSTPSFISSALSRLSGRKGEFGKNVDVLGPARQRGILWRLVSDSVAVALPAVTVWSVIDFIFGA